MSQGTMGGGGDVLTRVVKVQDATPGQVATTFLMQECYAVLPSSSGRGRIEVDRAAQEPDEMDAEPRHAAGGRPVLLEVGRER